MADLSVPYLRSGPGDTPRDGGCVMQIVGLSRSVRGDAGMTGENLAKKRAGA